MEQEAEAHTPFETTFALINRARERAPDAIAATFITDVASGRPQVRWSYEAFVRRLQATARLLNDIGGPRPVTSIVMPTLPETELAIWGGQLCGVVNPINPFLEGKSDCRLHVQGES